MFFVNSASILYILRAILLFQIQPFYQKRNFSWEIMEENLVFRLKCCTFAEN